jgi:hypothetical protein
LLSARRNVLQTRLIRAALEQTSGLVGRESFLRELAAATGCLRGFAAESHAGSVRDAKEAGGRATKKDADLQGF